MAGQHSWDAQMHIWNYTQRYFSSMALKCAVELRIPDAIHKHGGRPVSLSRLVADLGIPLGKMGCLRRLMLALTNFGFFRLTVQGGSGVEEEEAYLLTNSSLLLLSDTTDHSLAAFVRVHLDPLLVTPWLSMSSWFHTSDSPSLFHLTNGLSFWEALSQKPEKNTMFNKCVASDSHLTLETIIEEHGQTLFGELTSLVDVGGGNGESAVAISRAFPHLKCTVLELPHVVDTVSKDRSKLVEFVAGNMFEYIPPADAILLKWILHDWGDEDCVKLLKLCKKAVPPGNKGGKVIIHDMVLSCDLPQQLSEMQYSFDLLMMVLTDGGKERNEREWQKLFSDAGFSGYKILTGLGLRTIIEVYH